MFFLFKDLKLKNSFLIVIKNSRTILMYITKVLQSACSIQYKRMLLAELF